MSKYEPRAAEIQAEAKAMGVKISWTRRKSTIFVHLVQEPIPNSFVSSVRYDQAKLWLQKWYPTAELTSWGLYSGTFKVYDTWDLLKAS